MGNTPSPPPPRYKTSLTTLRYWSWEEGRLGGEGTKEGQEEGGVGDGDDVWWRREGGWMVGWMELWMGGNTRTFSTQPLSA